MREQQTHLIVKLATDRSEFIKQELVGRLNAVIMEPWDVGTESVSIAMEEVPTEDWMERVYGPDIEAIDAQPLKRPEYGTLAGSSAA